MASLKPFSIGSFSVASATARGRLRPKTNGARVVNGFIIGVDAMGEEMVAMILFDHRFFKILLGNPL